MPAAGEPGGSGGTFGAEGPASVRDLGRAFTRVIPLACGSDPAWGTLAVGDTGKVEVRIHVDDTGHITSAEPQGVDPPRAFVNLVRRTVPLLQAGTFAVRQGAVSEGTEVFELRAVVSDLPVTAEQPNPFGLEHEYASGRGKARFTQVTGRHVEVTVKVVRVEAR